MADTSWLPYGVCAEMARIICERDPSALRSPIKNLGMAHAPCPTAKALEDMYYPDTHDISIAICELLGLTREVQHPKKQAMVDFYKHFKGPF